VIPSVTKPAPRSVNTRARVGKVKGGPLSPPLANVLMCEVGKAVEARGYSFVVYADDCNVYVVAPEIPPQPAQMLTF
jgi:retron-type reverse transcriptase